MALWKSYESEFADLRTDLQTKSNGAKEVIDLTLKQVVYQAMQLQICERKSASDY